MLSNTADYALRAILVLGRAHGGPALRAEEIASATAAPRNYMAKTLNALARAGIVTSARGPAGGFSLACAPAVLPLSRVIDCFDAPRPQRTCLLGTTSCDPAKPCTAHARWSAIAAARRASLCATTVADLLD